MNKKVDEDFKYINDVYVLQCICSEYKELVNNAIEKIKTYCINDEFYNKLSNKEKNIFDVLTYLQNGVDINE